ncbi:MAG TPA: hypothetical protein VIF15_19950 [Polyangiaceae bacterium]|jgi:hypothetical protein
MTRSPVRRTLLFLAMTVGMPVLVMGCPKKPVPVEDAAPPPEPPEAAVLAPLTDDGGDDGEAEAEAGKKWTGPGVNPNQQKISACCNAMRAQAKTLGASPEAFQLQAAAAQCDVFAKQVGPGGNAPELAQLRAMLKSVKLPAACQF